MRLEPLMPRTYAHPQPPHITRERFDCHSSASRAISLRGPRGPPGRWRSCFVGDELLHRQLTVTKSNSPFALYSARTGEAAIAIRGLSLADIQIRAMRLEVRIGFTCDAVNAASWET